MRFYQNCYELMSETGRNLVEMGTVTHPQSYQNKQIFADKNFETKELICEQYCLMSLNKEDYLFYYTRSKKWAYSEFLERMNDKYSPNPGIAYLTRKDVWEQFLNNRGEFDYTYNERLHYNNNLKQAVEEIKRNPDTRQAIVPIFSMEDPQYRGGKRRIPCSMYYNLLVREVNGVKQVNIAYHQRSSDFITHFGNDVFLAYKTMEYVSKITGYKPGYLYHTIDSLHVYRKDLELLKHHFDKEFEVDEK